MQAKPVIKLCLYGGTGIGKLLHPLGERYYRHILGEADIVKVVDGCHLISLPYAGLADHRLRHARVNQVRHRKIGKEPLLILIGHSQGALEAALHALRHPQQVLAVICLSGPFDGAPLAARFNWMPWLPDGVRQMVKGSRQLDDIQMLASQLGYLRAHGDVVCLPEFHLVAACDDGLVPQDSAWYLTPDYPTELVTRYLLMRGDQEVPEGIVPVRVSAMMSNHIGEILAPELLDVIVGIVQRHASALHVPEVEVGSV